MSATVLKRAPVGVVVHDGPWSEACDRYVAGHPDASAYHAPAWLDIVRRAFGHETRYFVAECDGAVAGVLPVVLFSSRIFGRFGVSVPFFNYGGVLADSDAAARALLEHAVVETRKAGGT